MNTGPDKQAPFRLTYEFNAGKERVFNAFASADALNAWWGPVESKNTVISLDFREGGIFHFSMEHEGTISYGRFLYGKIQPYDVLEFSNAFADAQANVVQAPVDMPFPREVYYRLHFTEKDGRTTLTMTGEPIHASDAETESFRNFDENMQQGFGRTFGKLAEFLGKSS